MTYTLIANEQHIIRDSDGAIIPPDPINRDYADYLAWVSQGNTANPPLLPVARPRAFQGKLIRYSLADLGVRDQFERAATSKQSYEDYWVCSAGDLIPEDNPKMTKWCDAVGITMKDLFDKAETYITT